MADTARKLIYKRWWVLAACIPLSLVLYRSGDGAAADGVVTREEYGEAWPLTVEEARLSCKGAAAYVTADGRTYALNGTAVLEGISRVDPIWAKHPVTPGIKLDLGELLNRARQPCQ